ncbi:Bud-site selection protein [Lipomyces oligophaga]|uniref:Bud-site selection protein n=1 Tax=Lipomyces oligophaga TaxID=45792 RepID=UPI0034CEC235
MVSESINKPRRENLLWKLDFLESKAAVGQKKPRLKRTKLAVESIQRREKKSKTDVTSYQIDHEHDLQTALQLRKEIVYKKVYYWTRELLRAIKKVRQVENQKLSRKLKEARQKNENTTVDKLEAELQTLRTIDLADVASLQFFKKLQKSKVLHESGLLPSEPVRVSNEQTVGLIDESLRIIIMARLFKPKSIQLVLNQGIEGILAAVALASNTSYKKPKQEDKPNHEKSQNEFVPGEGQIGKQMPSDNSRSENSDPEALDEDEEEAFDSYKHLLANSDSESDSGVADQQEDFEYYNQISDLEPSEDDSQNSSDSPLPPQPYARQRAVLPALSNGYISPDSSSDIEEDEFFGGSSGPSNKSQSLSKAGKLIKKNRRGQRARQKIWEQKYGSSAAHVLKQKEEKRVKVLEDREKYLARVARRTERELSAQPIDFLATGQEKGKPIHPSWEAKKKTIQPVEFKGKRIVFD